MGCCTPCIRVGAAAEQWRGAVEEQRRSSGEEHHPTASSLSCFYRESWVSSHNTEHRVCIGWQRKDKAGGMFWPGKLWRHVDAPQPFKFSFKWTTNRILPERIFKKKSRAATHIEEESLVLFTLNNSIAILALVCFSYAADMQTRASRAATLDAGAMIARKGM